MSDPDDDAGTARDPGIRSIARGFQILRVLNRRPVHSLHELHLETGLPKSTIFRILHTLQQEAYVECEGNPGLYRLTGRILELSGGYTEKSLLVELGSRAAKRLTRSLKWPVGIGVLEDDAIVVRYSGMPYSPVAAHATTLGQRLGLTDTAMGKVYLAFCPAVEREILFDMLRTRPGGGISDEAGLQHELARIREAGFAVRLPNTQRRTATLAVPVMHAEQVLGVMGMTTFGRMMTEATVAQFTPALQEAAAQIAAEFAQHNPAD
jgi:IclR family mhp operon transcriptional activator